MIPEAAAKAAAKAAYEFRYSGYKSWDDLTPLAQCDAEAEMQYALLAAAPHMFAQVTPIVRDLIDSDDCWFDHAGGCQAHGYISLQPGEICPQADAKEWVKAHG